uniref:Chondroitin proteoglycan 3 n=1 Tax=Caenorhabditis tropicalis TaxID=1561998 RepID=A0A1I7UJJ9_9PELO
MEASEIIHFESNSSEMRTVFIVALLLIGAAFAHPSNPLRSKRQALIENDEDTDFSGEFSGDASGEGSGSGDEASGEEGSGETVPVTELTIQQLETLNTYAQQVQAESQKLIHQANFVITEMTALAANAQNLGILSNVVLANSQIVLDSARLTLNETETIGGGDGSSSSTTASTPAACVSSSVCYNDSGCGSGKCIGALAGTCNCNSCVYGWPCQEDSACGGFIGACNSITATCDCFNAYSQHNMTLTDALTGFCNVAKCSGASDNVENCFGLPCNYGFCVC